MALQGQGAESKLRRAVVPGQREAVLSLLGVASPSRRCGATYSAQALGFSVQIFSEGNTQLQF